MTKPTTIYFGPDGGELRESKNKIYLRTLLYTTGKRGRIIENMFVRIKHRETAQNFSVWVHGDTNLVRGSGLYVPETGVLANHHFLLQGQQESFNFSHGIYSVEIYVTYMGQRKSYLLMQIQLNLTIELAHELKKMDGKGVYFDWSPDNQTYYSHSKSPPPKPKLPVFLLDSALSDDKEINAS
ncbi:hypothetical protein LPC08_08930 [Roseomonas sp. OT10]|uniref:hypothetical protein n=1 Tax=Roseomonas cutis TaxID=2897332 RepID=UPI001E635A03|nr:hypothetical protein [Roseomonas sp. OT10]UFN50717.1 hypothetical protein LPC08_08930 [Roseomonas sp. OT10]